MKIWLVQRGLMGTNKSGIDSLIQWDYMGSAEFEYGSLPAALKKTITLLPQLIKEKVTFGKTEMQFLCTKEQLPELKAFWSAQLLSLNKPILKELLYYTGNFGKSTNFWWDIENCWMATTGKIQLVVDALFNVKKKKGW